MENKMARFQACLYLLLSVSSKALENKLKVYLLFAGGKRDCTCRVRRVSTRKHEER